MIPKECKRLAEVDFPIAVVSKHAVREKSIRHGHPSTLHLWWARRPLASCRAMALGLLLPDPCDPNCPGEFKTEASKRLREVPGCNPGTTDKELRHALLRFIGDFSNWDVAAHPTYLQVGRALVASAHGGEPPLVVDPFSGGGSIPIEALRLGCDAFASDLNPVACLILKVMLEGIPSHGAAMADELLRVGEEIKKQSAEELAELYPPDPDGATPIAYLWARTVRCEAPNCGAEIPLVRSLWLCKKPSRRRALRYHVEQQGRDAPRVEFEVCEPQNEKEVQGGIVSRAKATCVCCKTVLPPERVRAQLFAQHGGADAIFDANGRRTGGARLLAVVTLKTNESGRRYRLPTDRDYGVVHKAHLRLSKALANWEAEGRRGFCPVPDEPLPPVGTLGFRVQRYGMLKWGDLFTARQKVAFYRSAGLGSSDRLRPHMREVIALCLSRAAARNSSLCLWLSQGDQETVWTTFGRNALPLVWDFAEAVPISQSTGSLEDSFTVAAQAIASYPPSLSTPAQVQQCDAAGDYPLPDDSCSLWFTDPPYYDAIPYSDLSDFFLVWLKRALPDHPLLRDPFDPENGLSPKLQEAVQDETKKENGRPKDRAWFEEKMARAFGKGRRVLREDGVGSVVFAHKTTEGWEALLSGMIRGGWTITGSWPIATERTGRPRAHGSAALATSVHLICRPRPDDAPVGDWGDVLRELPKRVGDWMERLQTEGIRGADLVFACIGPALEVFSRYRHVETADGRKVELAEYLAKVWEVVGRMALEQVLGTAEAKARNGAAGAIEEDARLTALFLWTIQATDVGVSDNGSDDEDDGEDSEADEEEAEGGGSMAKAKGLTLVYDVVRRFAQPLGIELSKWEGRVIETKKGVVRMLPVLERGEQLFGKEGAVAVADRLEQPAATKAQLTLFPDEVVETKKTKRGGKTVTANASDDALRSRREATTLDRVHAAMLLQAAGRANALRALLQGEIDRGPDFFRLANALSALYPKDCEEKRLLDAMLLAVPR